MYSIMFACVIRIRACACCCACENLAGGDSVIIINLIVVGGGDGCLEQLTFVTLGLGLGVATCTLCSRLDGRVCYG